LRERDIDNFICGIIKNDISTELRREPVMVALHDPQDDVEDGDDGEESNERNSDVGAESEIDENFIVSFEDPFEEKLEEIGAFELMKICYDLLEKEEPEMLLFLTNVPKESRTGK